MDARDWPALIMRVEDGVNREEWDEIDGLKFLRGLGAIPS